MRAALLRRAVSVAGLGGILVSFSEFWFYDVTPDVNTGLILLAYGMLGWLFLMIVQRFRVTSRAGFIVAVALLGFLIEGVPVPVLYSDLPMSILWTSLAWHGLITVGIGWYAFRRVMLRGSWILIALFNSGVGLFLGVWNAYSWNARETDASGDVRFEWQPIEAFTDQFLLGYALFVGGHLLFDRGYPKAAVFHRLEFWGLSSVAAGSAALTAWASGLVLPALVLPALVIGSVLLLWWDLRRDPALDMTFVDQLHVDKIPLPRFLLTLLIPFFAVLTYTTMADARIALETNVLVILTAGPASVWLLVWAVRRIMRPRF